VWKYFEIVACSTDVVLTTISAMDLPNNVHNRIVCFVLPDIPLGYNNYCSVSYTLMELVGFCFNTVGFALNNKIICEWSSSNWNTDIITFSFVCGICIACVCNVVNFLWVLPDTNKDGDGGTNHRVTHNFNCCVFA